MSLKNYDMIAIHYFKVGLLRGIELLKSAIDTHTPLHQRGTNIISHTLYNIKSVSFLEISGKQMLK